MEIKTLSRVFIYGRLLRCLSTSRLSLYNPSARQSTGFILDLPRFFLSLLSGHQPTITAESCPLGLLAFH